jgi:hypothetical protein
VPSRSELRLLAGLLALKLSFLFISNRPAFYLGDSLSYLFTATNGWISPERSFLYGFALRPMGVWFGSLRSVVVWQVFLSTVSAWIVALIAIRIFRESTAIAAVLSALCAIEPLQLLHERYILTETLAIFLFAVFVLAGFTFARTGAAKYLILTHAAGAAMIGVRMGFLPLVLANSVLLPLVTFRGFRKIAVWMALSVVVSQSLLYGYRILNGHLSRKPPAYMYADGFFVLSDVAPIVTAADLPVPEKRSEVFSPDLIPLNVPLYRQAQLFDAHGLCNAVRRSFPYGDEANAVANAMAMRAVVRDPLGFIRLGATTFGEFLNPVTLDAYLLEGEGGAVGAVPADQRADVVQRFGVDPVWQDLRDPVRWWHRAAKPWYWFVLVFAAAFPALAGVGWRRIDSVTLLCLVDCTILLATSIFLAPHATPRYLAPLAWFTFVMGSSVFYEAFSHGS